MTDRDRATTLRLRTPPPAAAAGNAAAPRAYATIQPRPGSEAARRQVHTFAPRRADPTSQAILAELAALGLAETDESE